MHQQGRGCSGKLLIAALQRQGKLKRAADPAANWRWVSSHCWLLFASNSHHNPTQHEREYADLHFSTVVMRCASLKCALHPARGNLFPLSSLESLVVFSFLIPGSGFCWLGLNADTGWLGGIPAEEFGALRQGVISQRRSKLTQCVPIEETVPLGLCCFKSRFDSLQ